MFQGFFCSLFSGVVLLSHGLKGKNTKTTIPLSLGKTMI